MRRDELLKLAAYILVEDSSSDDNDLFYSTEWTQNIDQMSPRQFSETFRMSPECFDKLVDKVSKYSSLISNLRFKLVVFLFFISHISSYRKLREIFGISHSSLHRIIGEISKELHKLASINIIFPNSDEYSELKEGFSAQCDMQGAILAIDGTQIKISRPSIPNPFDYYDRKGCFSITFVCVVDHMQRFCGVTYGFGKSHDARIYRTSELRNLVEGISDQSCYVLGDSAFSGFSKIRICTTTAPQPLTRAQEYDLAKQRIVVENAFGRFKGKFKRFESRIKNGEKKRYALIVKCAMWIHNFIIDNN